MSSIIIVTGRVTADPVMQQAKNSGTEYISLGLATNQRGQNGKEEPIFYQCYCNKFLADRLIKAGVKKSTCLMVYGDLELHPYIHQKGNNAGQAAITPQIMVKDWQFLPANRNDTNAATPVPGNPMVGNPNVPPVPANGATYNGNPGMNPSGTVPTGAMPVNNNMMPQAAQQMSYAPAGDRLMHHRDLRLAMYLVMDLPIFRKIHHHSSFHSRKLSKIPKMKELRLSSIYWSAAIPFSIETNMEEMK